MQSTKSVKSNFSHTTIVDEQVFNDMKLPKISISASSDHLRRCSNIIEECEDYPSLPTKVKKVRWIVAKFELHFIYFVWGILFTLILLSYVDKWEFADDHSGRATTEEGRHREKGFTNNYGLDA